MVSFWRTSSWSFRLYVQSWRVFDGHLCHLLLMMSLDFLLTIHHKKGGVHMDGDFVDRGRFFFVLELWSCRLYLGASLCTYFWLMISLLFDVFIFYELYMIGEYIMFLFLFLVSHCATLIIDLYL